MSLRTLAKDWKGEGGGKGGREGRRGRGGEGGAVGSFVLINVICTFDSHTNQVLHMISILVRFR